MGAGAVKAAESPPPETNPHDTNSPRHSVPKAHPPDVMSCEGCSANFTFIKRKKPCSDCGRNHCSDCLIKESIGKLTKRRCTKCRMLTSGNFSRSDLMKLTIKDLRHFMTRRMIPMNNCTEKVDLVELLMKTSNNSHYQKELADQRQHLLVLEERKRQHEAEFDSAQDSPPPSNNAGQNPPHTQQNVQIPPSQDLPTPPETNNTTTILEAPEAQSVHSSSSGADDAESVIDDISDSQTQQQQPQGEETVPEEETTEYNDATSDGPQSKRKYAHLKDVPDIDSIENLTIRQLKEILATNYVDYKGCCEKRELIERVRRLYKEKTKETERQSGLSDNDVCKICMDAMIDCVLLDCGHMVTCTQCGKQMSECPVCRQYVVRVVHVFKA